MFEGRRRRLAITSAGTSRLGLHGKISLPQSANWQKSEAYMAIRSTGEGVSINLAGREPDGIVDPADFEKVCDRVTNALGESSIRRWDASR